MSMKTHPEFNGLSQIEHNPFKEELKCARCDSRMDVKPLDKNHVMVQCSFCGNRVGIILDDEGYIKEVI